MKKFSAKWKFVLRRQRRSLVATMEAAAKRKRAIAVCVTANLCWRHSRQGGRRQLKSVNGHYKGRKYAKLHATFKNSRSAFYAKLESWPPMRSGAAISARRTVVSKPARSGERRWLCAIGFYPAKWQK